MANELSPKNKHTQPFLVFDIKIRTDVIFDRLVTDRSVSLQNLNFDEPQEKQLFAQKPKGQ